MSDQLQGCSTSWSSDLLVQNICLHSCCRRSRLIAQGAGLKKNSEGTGGSVGVDASQKTGEHGEGYRPRPYLPQTRVKSRSDSLVVFTKIIDTRAVGSLCQPHGGWKFDETGGCHSSMGLKPPPHFLSPPLPRQFAVRLTVIRVRLSW